MSGIRLGQYIHGNSLIHSLDPRTKIVCCLLMIIAVVIAHQWYYLLFFLLLILITIGAAGLHLGSILKSLFKMKYLFLFTLIFQAFLTAGDPIFTVGKLGVTPEGLILGALNVVRLIILFMGSMIVLMTTSPLKLAAGIELLLQPLAKIKIPVYNFSTILSISFRFIPTLFEEASTIKNAQSSRGAQFESPNLIVRIKSYMAILIPLFEASLVKAADLGEAMDSRCFSPHLNTLRVSRLHMGRKDIIVLCFMILITASGIVLTVYR
ncbi:energy-coupling factor transporter transmembrane protein EcfT [Dehalobacter sp. DCM]|uniref:energy-coupling factor transporter transmembrane component T family protein n=1 Tax=Dehalobacter sp. DCM TaxID=2907827 RepID=UPI0030821DC2|nr:energy-coupling factor transporter transmembrane protein EcfT [Dehalobacter sp. DCM]